MNTRTRLGSLLGVICTLSLALVLMGCPPEDDGISIVGTWSSSSGDSFTVTDTTFSYAAGDPSWGMDYEGTIESGSDSPTSPSGYLVVHLTSSGSSNAFNTGEYICIHWKDLTATSVQEAGPYKSGGDNGGAASASAAKAKFTEAAGYFDMHSPYTKQ